MAETQTQEGTQYQNLEQRVAEASKQAVKEDIDALSKNVVEAINNAKPQDTTQNVSQEQGGMLGGAVSSIERMDIAGIPVGEALVGGGFALLTTEVVDAIVPASIKEKLPAEYGSAMLKGGTAYALKKWGSGLLGKRATDLAVLFMTFDAIQDVLPISSGIDKLIPGHGIPSNIAKTSEGGLTSEGEAPEGEAPEGEVTEGEAPEGEYEVGGGAVGESVTEKAERLLETY